MHIAIVRTVFDRNHGGAEAYAVNLARTWLEDGHRISIVCHRASPTDAAGMDVVNVSRPRVLGPWKHRWFADRAGKAAKETGADAVLCLAKALPGDVLRLGDGLHCAWLESRFPDAARRKRALLNPRHSELARLERALFEPGTFRLYVANSALIRDRVIAEYGVDSSIIEVIPNGVDPERFHTGLRGTGPKVRADHGIPPDAGLILFSGMDFRRKGLMEAARGFAKLASRNDTVRFACVGKGDAEPARELLRAAGVLERCIFLPQTTEIAAWYAAADVFVLPTLHDPSANAVTESLACGTPVVTSAENGARQHIQDGKNGWVLKDRSDASEIADRCEQLLTTKLEPASVTAAASLLTQKENADRLLAVLKEAAEK